MLPRYKIKKVLGTHTWGVWDTRNKKFYGKYGCISFMRKEIAEEICEKLNLENDKLENTECVEKYW